MSNVMQDAGPRARKTAGKPPIKAKSWSSPATSTRALTLLDGIDWTRAKVADVGAGRGYFSRLLAESVVGPRGLDPRAHVFPCDLIPASFEYEGLECSATGRDGRLPFADASMDVAVSIEVIEHVEDQFAFLRELARIVKPGGTVIVSTPNVLNMNSRLRTLFFGFPVLFDPLPLGEHDSRRLGGHVHPITPYFLAYAALRAGLVDATLHSDRTKRSAAVLTVLCSPALILARAFHRLRMSRKKPDVLRENREILGMQDGWSLLTSRTAVLAATKPALHDGVAGREHARV